MPNRSMQVRHILQREVCSHTKGSCFEGICFSVAVLWVHCCLVALGLAPEDVLNGAKQAFEDFPLHGEAPNLFRERENTRSAWFILDDGKFTKIVPSLVDHNLPRL